MGLRVRVAAAVWSVILATLALAGLGMPRATAASNGKIAYSSRKQIFTMSRDGSNVRQVTDTKTSNRTPAWSPQGDAIAYGCRGDRNGEKDICVSSWDGRRRRNVTDDAELDRDPDWAPGGKRLVFARRVDAVYQLFIIDRGGENLTQLTTTVAEARDPEWSPDGDRIVFTALGPFGGPDIFSINSEGQELVNLTMSTELEGSASWSPDADEIVFARDDELFLMSADGSDPQALGVRGNNPKWAPNGKRVIAHRLREAQYQRCFSVQLDGTGTHWLSPRHRQCYSPDWAPRRTG